MAPVKPATPTSSRDKSYASLLSKPKSMEVLVTVLMSSKNPSSFGIELQHIDWDLVAQRLGLKNAKVASTRFGQVKKELLECHEGSTGNSSPVKTLGSASAPSTPTKVGKPRGRKPKSQKVKVEDELEEPKTSESIKTED